MYSKSKRDFDRVIAVSEYTRPVDKKKLRFILNAINKYSTETEREIKELRVLEAGCGRGGVTLSLAALGCYVVAFDVDKKSTEYVEKHLINKSLSNVEILVADACSYNDDMEYDIIIASELFEHVLNPSLLAVNLLRRMSKKGILIVTTPNGYGPWELKNKLKIQEIKKNKVFRKLFKKSTYRYSGNTHEHCQFFRRSQLIHMFNDLSLHLINFGKSDSILTVIPILIYRKYRWIAKIDMIMADILPYWLASGWYFVYEKHKASS